MLLTARATKQCSDLQRLMVNILILQAIHNVGLFCQNLLKFIKSLITESLVAFLTQEEKLLCLS